MLFFTADTHFGHKNVIAHCARPFRDVESMDRAMRNAWNLKVGSQDTVYVLGDFSFYNSSRTADILASLSGKKILVRGNHDDVKSQEKAARLGWHAFHPGNTSLEVDGITLNLSHYPYTGDHTEQDRYLERRPVDDGNWLLHGHVHHKWLTNGNMLNVGVDVWRFAPVSMDEVLRLL